MKISYRREMKHNYLIIDPEELIWKNYECSMLAKNTIEGVLHFQLRQIDDEIRFFYEITSRQPLGRLLENQAIGAEELRRLVLGISAVLDRIEQYLLPEGCILLEPDYLYVEPETFRVCLCLVPGLERDFPEDCGKLLEYLLGKVDHQDKESVVLAYGLYQETRKENYGMEDILRHLRSEEPETGRQKPEEERKEYTPYLEQKMEAPPEKSGIWKRLRQWLRRRKADESEELIRVPMEMLFREEAAPEGGVLKAETFTAEERKIRKQSAERTEAGKPAEARDTVLLADLSQAVGPETRCLRALDKGMEDISISYFPFIIGKQKNLADYLLMHDTVSRLHVRIDQDGDGWKIQDLNSTNGTMVGGRLLENNEAAAVHLGDEVKIAEFRYRYE